MRWPWSKRTAATGPSAPRLDESTYVGVIWCRNCKRFWRLRIMRGITVAKRCEGLSCAGCGVPDCRPALGQEYLASLTCPEMPVDDGQPAGSEADCDLT
jgi:hypothetical protein